jgi:monofunctional biosynthetic peptidoglycan transglycosylase
MSDTTKLIDFAAASPDDWFVVNDDVMGGRSSGGLNAAGSGTAAFEGHVSLENNGGFTTVRTEIPDGALAGGSQILLRVRGDGKRYQLRLHPGRRYDGVAYAASFDAPPGQWTTVVLPLDAFEPTFRGRRPQGAKPLEPARIGQIGIMITDKQEGPFRLEVEWIGVDR